MTEIILKSDPSQILNYEIRQRLIAAKPKVLGVVSAFVTLDGVRTFSKALKTIKAKECRLIAGTSLHITHPQALKEAKKIGWRVRIGKSPKAPGIFHPKLIVGGESFDRNGVIQNICFVCIGSANLTGRGLTKNTECSLITTIDDCAQDAPMAFKLFWEESIPADRSALKNYSAEFAEKNRQRSTKELDNLGVSDEEIEQSKSIIHKKKPPQKSAVDNSFAKAAWTGLESFTGAWTFQVEFPRAAGEVVHRLVGRRKSRDGYVQVYCPSDNKTCRMKFSFYKDNSMFRLNIPNDIKGVDWARKNKEGIALVEAGPVGGAPVRLSLFCPGIEANEVIARSHALGSWGKTTSRLYGWY